MRIYWAFDLDSAVCHVDTGTDIDDLERISIEKESLRCGNSDATEIIVKNGVFDCNDLHF